MDLTLRVAMMDSSPDDYIKLDFELLRIELRDFEALVSQLKDSLNASSPMLDSLYTEVRRRVQDPVSLLCCSSPTGDVLHVFICARSKT